MALHSAGLSPGLADNLDSGEVLARTILQVLHLDDVKLQYKTYFQIFSPRVVISAPLCGHG